MFPAEVAERLREVGHDAVAVLERPELAGASDPAVMAAAVAERRIVVTENWVDFDPLSRATADHPGILVIVRRTVPRHQHLPAAVSDRVAAWAATHPQPPSGLVDWP